MMRTLLGRRTSINVQKVAWVMREMNLPFEQIELGGLHRGTDTRAYLEKNPTGRVPTLVEGDFILWESNAICRYLVGSYGGPLALSDTHQAAQADMWMDWFQSSVYAAFIQTFYQTVRLPTPDRSAEVLDAALGTLAQAFSIPEALLSRQSFLCGEKPSLADVPFGACLYRYFDMAIDRPEQPAIRAYFERLTARPAYQEVVMTSYESLRAPG